MLVMMTWVAAYGEKPVPPWLRRINMYRSMEQMTPIANDPALSEGAQNHAAYLVKNLARRVRDGSATSAEIGSEAAGKPAFTRSGHSIAPHCEVDFELGKHPSVDAAIDTWFQGPYHRMLLLNPALERIGYGYYCENGLCAQAVDVEDGIARAPVDARKQMAIEFPPANSTLSLSELRHEEPSPLEACPGYAYPVGLPITFEIGSFADAELSSWSIISKDDPHATPLEACGYDAWKYRNERPSEQATVAGGLHAFSGVVVIPRHPLAPGNYRASVTVNDNEYSWSFAIAPPAAAEDARSASR